MIKAAFEYYAIGDWSVSDLVDYLKSRGLESIPTPSRPARPIGQTTLHQMLSNPYYKGVITFKGAQYPGRHTPLVDEITWQKVQDVLASHRNGERTRIHNHFLKSTLYCGTCGRRLIVHNAKSRSGAYYPYFVCASKHDKHRCSQHAVLIDKVEEEVERLYEYISLTPESRKLLEAWFQEEITRRGKSSKDEIADLNKQVKKLKDEEAKLLQAHYAEAISLELLKSEQGRIAKALADIEARLKRLSADSQAIRGNLAQVLDLIEDCGQTYKKASDYGKRLMNQAFFEKIVVNPNGRIEPEYNEIVGILLDPRLKIALRGTTMTSVRENMSKTTDIPLNTETAVTRPEKARKNQKSVASEGSRLTDWLSKQVDPDIFFVEGLRNKLMVEYGGVEPPTSAMRMPRSSQLS